MELLPNWENRLTQDTSRPELRTQRLNLPKSPEFYSQRIHFVDSPEASADMVQLALERRISWAGFDTEFRYDDPPVQVGNDQVNYDPRSIHPLLLSFCFAEPRDDAVILYNFVVDLRVKSTRDLLKHVLSLPVPFVGHFSQVELFCLWQLNLRGPRQLWDSWVAEKVQHLGLNNSHYKLPMQPDNADQARIKQDCEEDKIIRFSLVATCRRHNVPYLPVTKSDYNGPSWTIPMTEASANSR